MELYVDHCAYVSFTCPIMLGSSCYVLLVSSATDGGDIYDRLYPKRNYPEENARWGLDRDANFFRPFRPASNTNNYGSRKTLQGSMEGSMCTADNKSEITGKPSYWEMNLNDLSTRILLLR